ncbi:putative polyprotein [Cucumis melo var. makuwa]|uniref:Polyprotein n=2 Tax=Cucumis melo var. makuwa TaxID=1194695 RepID=A0A5A7V7K1_CUCMM|nr:putative polyprotein [Cucumis melo var. makuwa]
MTHFELGEVSFMVKEGIVLGHKISHARLEVNPTKIDVKIHSRIFPDRQTSQYLLCVDQSYDFDEKCNQAFQTIKDALTSKPILITSDWSQPFELMCDTSDVVVGNMLG